MISIRSRTGLVLALIPATCLLAACGDDGTGPSGPGTMSVVVTDTPPPTGTPVSPAVALVGAFDGTLRVQISADGSTWTDVGGTAPVSLELQGGEPVEVEAGVEVPGGTYRHVRALVSDAAVDLEQGTAIGDETLDEPVRLGVAEGAEMTVEREVFRFVVDAETPMTVVVDLVSGSWVTADAVLAGGVTADAFRAGVSVEARRSEVPDEDDS